jgi:hypothetical protein
MTATDTETELAERIAMRLADYDGEVAALPSDDDLTTLREVDANRRRRKMLTQRRGKLVSLQIAVAEKDKQIAPLVRYAAHLREAEAEVTTQLAVFPTLSPQERDNRFREEQALTDAKRAIRFGISYLGHMALLPKPLNDFLYAKGYQPLNGQSNPFSGRGTLPATEVEIARLERERVAHMAFIYAELDTELP